MTERGSSAESQDSQQVRVLTINKGEHLDGILYRLKKGIDIA